MHRSRRSEVLLRAPSPVYHGRDNYPYDYFPVRGMDMARRSRSLEANDFLRDTYYDDFENRRFERNNMMNATLPNRRYDYQPYYISQRARESKYYGDEPVRFQPTETLTTNQHYPAGQPVDLDWRYERSYRDKPGSPNATSSFQEDYDYRSPYGASRSYNNWSHSYYKESAVPATAAANATGSGYMTTNTFNRGGRVKTFPKTYPRRDMREQKYRLVHCCCFNFRWPPWGVEETEPPRPMYRHY